MSSASRAFFCAASDDDKVEANRRGAPALRSARDEVQIVNFISVFVTFLGKQWDFMSEMLLKGFGRLVGE